LGGHEGVERDRSVVSDSLGRIWFSTNRGIAVVDPTRLEIASAATAIVHIQSLSADNHAIGLVPPVLVPAAPGRITFDYVGLALSAPEKVRYRYRLDGYDHGWSEPTSEREAPYTNLGPATYRFRVIASNAAGFFNGSEAALEFRIAPSFWQTWWFISGVVLTFGLALFAFYRLRLHQLTSELNLRFEERLAERTRIAQDLHDTLLQGLLSASMQLDLAVNNVPAELPAKPALSHVLELMRQVIQEGRNAVRGLRSSSARASDLAESLSRVPQELAIDPSTEFKVIVEGRPKALHPLIRDDVYRIVREALVNAFRHSGAQAVSVELDYTDNQLRILVHDNGRGIDPEVLQSGREGHWGLSGMRERTERIGGQLKLWSGPAAGTEIELVVPGPIAFVAGAKSNEDPRT
jgi:signal transduction histidine kinase